MNGAEEVIVELNNPDEFSQSTMAGDITVTGGAELRKTGAGVFTFSGTLSTDGELVIQEGRFNQSGGYIASDSSATITVGGGAFTQSGGYIASDSSATITVGGGAFTQSGGYIASDSSATITVEGGAFTQSGGYIASDSSATITVEGGTFTQSGGHIAYNNGSSATITVGGGTFTQSGGHIAYNNGSSATITVEGGTFTQSGGYIAYNNGSSATIIVEGGTFTQRDGGYIAYNNGSSATITVEGGTFTKSGGYIAYNNGSSATITVKGGAFTQSGGTIAYNSSATITVENGGTFTQSGWMIAYLPSSSATITVENGGTFTQSGGYIAYNNGSSATITVENGGTFTQSGGDIACNPRSRATITVENGGNYNYSRGTIGDNSSFTVEDGGYFNLVNYANYTHSTALKGAGHITVNDHATYDLNGNKGTLDIIMHGGKLTNAGSYAKNVKIDTGSKYSGKVSLGGLDAARIESVTIAGAATSITEMANGSTLSFHEGDSITVGSGHMSDVDGEARDGYILNFTDGSGSVAFAEDGAVVLNFAAGVFSKDKEKGDFRKEIWLTNGTIGGVPTEDIESWLEEHFVLGAGLEDLSLKYIEDVDGGKLLLYGNTDGIWIASRNGQEVTSVTRLDKFNQVQADVDLTLNPGEAGTMHVRQLQSGGRKGDLIVKSVAGLTVQLVNEHTDENGINGDTVFGGDIRVEEWGGATAILEKTGSASLTVSGNVTTGGEVQVSAGTLKLAGEGNSIGSLAMGGGKLDVAGTLRLTGTTAMTEASTGTITGTGDLEMGTGASLTLDGSVSYSVSNTTLEGGAAFTNNSSSAMQGDFRLQDSARLGIGSAGASGSVSLQDKAVLDLGNANASDLTVTMEGGQLVKGGSFQGHVAVQTGSSYSGEIKLGGVDAACITSINTQGSDTYLTGLKAGSTLTLSGENSMAVSTNNLNYEKSSKTYLIQFEEDRGTIAFAEGEDEGSVGFELKLDAKVIAALRKQEGGVELYFTNGVISEVPELNMDDEESVKAWKEWVKEHIHFTKTLESLGYAVVGIEGGKLLISGSTEDIYIVTAHGQTVTSPLQLGRYAAVVVDDDLTLNFNVKEKPEENSVIHNLLSGAGDETGDLIVNKSGEYALTLELNNTEDSELNSYRNFVGNLTVTVGKDAGELSLIKTGTEKLTVGGNLTTPGSLEVQKGTLELGGADSSVGSLEVKDGAGLVLSDKAKLTMGNNALATGSISGPGELDWDGELSLSGAVKLDGVTLDMEGGESLEIDGVTVSMGDGQIGGGESSVSIAVENNGSFTMEDGFLGSGKEDGATATLDVKGSEFVQVGGDIREGAEVNLSEGATMEQSGGWIKGGTIALEGATTSLAQGEQGRISGGSFTLENGASLRNGGKISGGNFSLSGSGTKMEGAGAISSGAFTLSEGATMSQGGSITGGTYGLSGVGTSFTQTDGSISGVEFTLDEGATLTQSGGEVAGGTFSLSGAASLRNGGKISGGSFSLSGSGTKMEGAGAISSGAFTLSEGATMSQSGSITGGTYELSGEETSFTQTGGSISGVEFTLDEGATLTQSTGSITDGTFTLSGKASLRNDGKISGGSFSLSGSGTKMEGAGAISNGDFTLSEGATMSQGGNITGGTYELSGEGTGFTQTDGSISGVEFTLDEGAVLTQNGGEISDGVFTLSGGATMETSGNVTGGTFTLSGTGTSFTQSEGTIDGDVEITLKDGARLALSGGSMAGNVTLEGAASVYDMGSQTAGGSVLMKGGKLEDAGAFEGELSIETATEYTEALELGGVDAACITKVVTGSSQTELHDLKSGSKLTFRDGESKMVVGVEHVYREGQEASSMVQFRGGNGQIAFEEGGTLQLHLNSEVLKGIEGQLEILFTNGSFSGKPVGQEKLEAWLQAHFGLKAGIDGIKVLLLDDVHGGRLVLTGSTDGIWITSRNGQSVDVADLLNRYSAVFADEDLTLTLPTTPEETPTIVNQLQNKSGEGDFIVRTEAKATANHTVQLHNAHTNEHQNNGDTDFYGDIEVEGEGLEAATLEKTGNATLTVHGDVTTAGTVRMSEGVLELEGEGNSIGSLAMGGTDEAGYETSGQLQVDGTLTLTGTSVMTEESRGSITGTGAVELGSEASLTLAGEVSYTVQKTELTGGAQMKQQGESSITGGSFQLSGTGTTFVQEDGSISDADFSLTEGAAMEAGGSVTGGSIALSGEGVKFTQTGGSLSGVELTLSEGATMETKGSITGGSMELSGTGTSLTQSAGSIGEGVDIQLKDGAGIILSGGSMAGSVTLEGAASAYDMGGQEAGGSVLMRGGKLENAENYAGSLTIQTDDAYTGDLELGGVDAARITDVQTKGEVRLTRLKEGSTLTLHGDHSMRVAVGNTNYGEQEAQALIEFNGTGGHVALEGNMTLLLDLSADVLAGLRKQENFELLFTNGDFVTGGKDDLTWVQEHFMFREVLEKLGFAVESVKGGSLIISGSTEDLYIVGEDGRVVDSALQLGRYKGVIVDEDLTLELNVQEDAVENSVLRNVDSLGRQTDLNIEKSGEGNITVELHNDEDTDTELGGNLTVTREDQGTGSADLLKSGKGKLTVGGKLRTEDKLTVADGTLALEGQGSSVGELKLGSIDEEGNETSGELQVDGTLTLTGDSDMSDDRGSITGGGRLVVDGEVQLGEGVQMDGPALELGSEGSLTASGELHLQGLNGQGSLFADNVIVKGSGGSFGGTLAGSLTVAGQQTLTGEVRGSEADLHVQGGGELTLQGARAARSGEETLPSVGGPSYRSVENGQGGTLRIEAANEEASGRGGAGIHVEKDIVFRDDSTTELVFNMNSDRLWDEHDATMLETNRTIYIEDNAHFVLESLGEGFSSKRGDLVNVKVMQGSKVVLGAYTADDERVDTTGEETGEPELYSVSAPEENGLAGGDEATSEGNKEMGPAEESSPEITRRLDVVELRGLFRVYFTGAWLGVDETTGTVYLNGKYRTASLFNGVANSHNSHAGANLLWETSQVLDLFVDEGVLSAMSARVADTLESDPAEARRIMAAVAGSTVTSLSAAQRDVMRSRMQSVRNHAQAVSAPYESIEQKTRPYRVILVKGWKDDAREEPMLTRRDVRGLHAWVEGLGHFHEQHTRGDESGYRLNAWGGATGIDLRLSEETVAGLSISALYGDLTANASDTAKGDWDSYTVSLWERARDDRWAHTFVVSAALNDAKLNRTVNYGEGSYMTRGKTDGYSLGALYELSYDVPLDRDSTRVVQPFATASLMHGVVRGYAESSVDRTGLNVGEQDLTLATLALGARWLMLADAGEALNRTIRTELRAAVAQDFGERRAKADVALQANPGYATGVYGSRTGSTALQFGGNVIIPVTEVMDMTLDANAYLRAHSSSWNASVGVRFGF